MMSNRIIHVLHDFSQIYMFKMFKSQVLLELIQ